MKKMFVFGLGLCLLVSCQQKTRNNETVEVVPSDNTEIITDMHTAQNSLDYLGAYKGTLPSASGEGIRTILTIRDDGSYILHSTYLGKEDNEFEEKGTFTVDGNILTLHSSKADEQYYQIGENQLFKLDDSKQRIYGNLEDDYILVKE